MCESKAQGGRRCIAHHPATKVALGLNRVLYPDLSEVSRDALVHRLHEEARFAGMVRQPLIVERFEPWADATQFELEMAPEFSEKRFLLAALGRFVDRYHRDPSVADDAHMHVWKYLNPASEAEVDRRVRPDTQRVAVDLDGVLYDCHETIGQWMLARGYARPATPMRTYSLSDHWGVSDEVMWKEFNAAARAGLIFRHGEALPDGVAAVKRLYRDGHRIVVVTARNLPGLEKECRQATVKWLRDMRVPFDEVHLTGKKEEIDFDVLLDDAPSNVSRVTEFSKHGVIIDRPWNRREGAGHARRRWADVVAELTAPPVDEVLFASEPELSASARERSVPLGTKTGAGPAKTA